MTRENCGPKVTLLGDNRDVTNWGCQTTSAALINLLAKSGRNPATIMRRQYNRSWRISQLPFPKFEERQKLLGALSFALRALPFGRKIVKVVGEYDDPAELAETIVDAARHDSDLEEIVDKITSADILLINGEGSIILGHKPRLDLVLQSALAIIADAAGTEVHVVNAMVSPGPSGIPSVQGEALIRPLASVASSFTVRDPLSFDYAFQLGLRNLSYVPDALFSWFPHLQNPKTIVPRSTFHLANQDVLRSNFTHVDLIGEYVAITGNSQAAHCKSAAVDGFELLVRELRESIDIPIVLVSTCTGDAFLAEVADRCGVVVLPPSTPVAIGGAVLAGASALVSGRWHPSIMALLGGGRLIYQSANSHKMQALSLMAWGDSPRKVYSSVPQSEDIVGIVKDVREVLERGLEHNVLGRVRDLSELSVFGYEEVFHRLFA